MKRYNFSWLLLSLLILNGQVSSVSAQEGRVSSSLLASGIWHKMAVLTEGIYRLDYSTVKQMGLSNPSNPRIYANNFGQLSYYNNDDSPDDLKEISLFISKGSDGIFNEGDYLLFYAQGTNRWRFNGSSGNYDYVRHNYSDTAFYFLTSSSSPGREISASATVSGAPAYTSDSYDALFVHEIEKVNLIESGREWFQPMLSGNGIKINPGFSDILTDEPVDFSFKVLGRASIPTMFRLYEGETLLAGVLVPEVSILSTTGTYARDVSAVGSSLPASANPSYEVVFYNNGEQSAQGWLDYLKLKGRALLSYKNKPLKFSDSRSVSTGRITQFTLKSTTSGINIWDISDPDNPGIMQYERIGENDVFRSNTDSLKTFLAFTSADILTPLIKKNPVANQNLHGSAPAEMVIVTHPMFIKYAEKLSRFHLQNDGLVSLIVTPEEIYNEFSGGIPDIAAIRNFLRMKYQNQKGTSLPLKYLLLFGDGSFENKKQPPLNPNFIPTYQSLNSTVVVSSFTSDDFFGLLDEGEGEAYGVEDLGIGRLPVSDTVQASILVSKVIKYMSKDNQGSWKNVIAITADDEDGNTHMMDAEGLYSLLNTKYPSFNVDKIYLDAFRQVTSANGNSYPDVIRKIDDRINSGCLIFDYLGHGNEIGLAHERVVKTENINSWRNGAKMPLFITATCEFSRFDLVEPEQLTGGWTGKNSAGEMVLFNRDGGGIALMTTTRVVYSAPNYTLNRNILNYAFTKDSLGNALRLGDIIRIAKNNSGSGMNKRNFSLLGDPAAILAYPSHGKVVTDAVNNIPVTEASDSLKALSHITITGHVEDNDGMLLNDFSGLVYPQVYDKVSRVKTLANDGGQVMEFDLRNNILFSGKTRASDGRFSFTFIVPRDIDYSFGTGKISYYASEDGLDMAGNFNDIIVGGFNNSTVTDTSGPEIRVFLNDTLFRSGGISDNNPLLLAVIQDEGGINTTGSGIGHDLTAFLDGNRNLTFILNNFFESDVDNYRKGRIYYPIGEIEKGSHSVTVKAWDNYNNSSEETILFLVRGENGFVITNLLNYPNPVTDMTHITAEHNRPDDELKVRISIYNMGGKAIKLIETTLVSTGYRLPPLLWDGNDDGGKRVARGIYPYTIVITTSEGEVSRASGRMIIL